MAKPASARARPTCSARTYAGSPALARPVPNTLTTISSMRLATRTVQQTPRQQDVPVTGGEFEFACEGEGAVALGDFHFIAAAEDAEEVFDHQLITGCQ